MILYKPTQYAFYTEGPSLTEQEHKNSTDAKLMLQRAAKGQDVYTRSVNYGSDDMNYDLTQHLIQKQTLEAELLSHAQNSDFSEEELKSIPQTILQKFGIKARKKSQMPVPPKNDDQTTNNGVGQSLPITPSIPHRSDDPSKP